MRLSPREVDKLLLHNAGFLAQKRLARGVCLNYPEAIALLATQILELIRDGRRVAELMDVGRRILGRRQVMEGVPEMIHEVQVEGTFPDGTKLVTVHRPIALEHGDSDLALYGSFLPVPPLDRFDASDATAIVPGEHFVAPGEILLNEGRRETTLTTTNRGDRPIQVGSHYPFADTNRALEFDCPLAAGMRLDIPAGAAVRFEPGESKTVRLVEVGPIPAPALADGPGQGRAP